MKKTTMKKDDQPRYTYFWNRRPGEFVNKLTGQKVSVMLKGFNVGPKFEGSVNEWYETLVETIIDMKKHLETVAGTKVDRTIVRCAPDVTPILNGSVLFVPKGDDWNAGTIPIREIDVVTDNDQERFQVTVEVEFKLGGRSCSEAGRVIVTED
jgi:hypothetical protein